MAIRKFSLVTLSTFFYIGYLPFIPGTLASLAAVFLFYLIKDSSLAALFACILIATGFLVAGRAEDIYGKKDARCIVIDEVSGMFLSLLFLPIDIKVILGAFLIFRLLDTFKPYPAGILEKLKGSGGIMLDDIVAGIYTNIILQLALRLATFRAS